MAGKYNIRVTQGDPLDVPLTWRDSANAIVPCSTRTARMKVKTGPISAVAILDLTSPVVSGKGIALADTSPNVHLKDTEAHIAGIAPGVYQYDLEIVSAGGTPVKRLLKGKFIVEGEITS